MKQTLENNTWSLGVVTANTLLLEGLKSLVRRSLLRIVRSYASPSELHTEVPDGADLAGLIIDASSLDEAELERLKSTCPGCKIIVLSDAEGWRREAMGVGQGPDGVVLTSAPAPVVLKTLELILLGERVFPAPVSERKRHAQPTPAVLKADGAALPVPPGDGSAARPVPPHLRSVSIRELEILRQLCRGDAKQVIARELDIAEATVKVHVKAILRKTQARNRTEAALPARPHLDALEKAARPAPDDSGMTAREGGENERGQSSSC